MMATIPGVPPPDLPDLIRIEDRLSFHEPGLSGSHELELWFAPHPRKRADGTQRNP
jgi:hypothetical protein